MRFRGFSLMHFGNIIYTFKSLSRKSFKSISSVDKDFLKDPESIRKEIKERPKIIIDIDPIDKKNTWFIGYISKVKYDEELDHLVKEIERNPDNEEYKDLGVFYENLFYKIQETHNKGKNNAEKYLVWDYLDVYVATSMRNRCEFEETYESIKNIFNKAIVKEMKLRVFDPTQSHCSFFRDKGLIEGLMLKRANCTIYMVQETDTMGKDSELAATLAQKKPVIAFVPDYSEEILFKMIKDNELDEIEKKIYLFKAQRIFSEVEFLVGKEKLLLREIIIDVDLILNEFIISYESYHKEHHFTLNPSYKEEYLKIFLKFNELCKILALATKVSLTKRANLLKNSHPLGMQIDLDSGVANGLIIVRNEDDCAKILRDLLTNSLEFEIEHIKEEFEFEHIKEEFGYTGLFEKSTGSLYRIITDDDLLTNSFWNFFYKV
jgi:hypothetical protein